MYQQVPSSHVQKRKLSSTNERKTKRRFAETPRDVSEGPEFHIEEAEVAMEIQEQSEGPEFHMEDAEGAREVLEQLEGPEFHMEDAEGAREVQGQPEHPQPQGRAGRDRRRLQLWQWNRIYPRGPYTPEIYLSQAMKECSNHYLQIQQQKISSNFLSMRI